MGPVCRGTLAAATLTAGIAPRGQATVQKHTQNFARPQQAQRRGRTPSAMGMDASSVQGHTHPHGDVSLQKGQGEVKRL